MNLFRSGFLESVLIPCLLPLLSSLALCALAGERSSFPNSHPLSSLEGTYDVGGGSFDFASIAEAVDSLIATGITGPATFRIYPGAYGGPLSFGPVSGASETAWIEFISAYPESTVTISSVGASGTGVITFNSSSFIRFEGISVQSIGDLGQRAIVIENGSSNLQFRRGSITGSGTGLATSYAIEVRGAACDSLLFDSLDVSNAADAFHLTSSTQSGRFNRITNCSTSNIKRSVYLDHQHLCSIEHSDLRADAGTTAEVDGIYVGTLLAGDTVAIHGNRIHDLATAASRAVGIKVAAVNAAAVIRIYNNFIYGFLNTGSSQIRALDITSGQCEVYSNSIYINDAAATGWSYGIHHGIFNPAVSLKLRNNILFNNKSTNNAYCVYVQSPIGALDSDYNIFYGTGAQYCLGRFANLNRCNLASWQNATGDDSQSLEGDPLFTSEQDLHLSDSGGMAHQNGAPIAYIIDDIDGELRDSPPDRGADEYFFTAPAADFAILEIVNACELCPELSNITVEVVVQNRGSEMQSDVPVRVYYLEQPRAETPITLAPLQIDTLAITWTTGFAPTSGELRIEAILAEDPNQDDNSVATQISVIGQPLHGNYHIGGINADYATFNDAISALQSLGISDTVAFEVAAGTYVESIVIPYIVGIAPARPVIFRKSLDSEGPVTMISSSGPATVLFDSANYVTFDGISITALTPNDIALKLDRESSHNTIKNALIESSSLTDISANAVRVAGGGCHNNRFENLTVSGGYFGFRLDGSTADPDSHTVIESCTITSSVRGIFALRQKDCKILRNTVSPGYEGAEVHSYGIYLSSIVAGDSVLVEGNIITGGRGNGDSHGILSATGTGTGLIYNNFITDWRMTGSGSVYGIQVGSGTGKVYHNSIRMTDITGGGDVAAMSINGSSTLMIARNNAVDITECDDFAYCWKLQNGTLDSDYNVYFIQCDNDSFYFGRSGVSTFYDDLETWTASTLQDENSLFADPGFVSDTDLHIRTFMSTLDGNAIVLPEITADIDGELREPLPDVGADEYTYETPSLDYSVAWLNAPEDQVLALTAYDFDVVVINQGLTDQIEVPVRLFYNSGIESETLVSLTSGQQDTVTLSWTTPDVDLENGFLTVQCFLDGDLIAWNDRAQVTITVTGPPLAGTYQIGGGTSDFASLEQAAEALAYRGVSAPVTIELYPGEYIETVTFSQIAGVSAANIVRIQPADGDTASVFIRSLTGNAVITLDGTDYVWFDGINLKADGDCKGALALLSMSSHNIFSRARLQASDSTDVNSFGALIHVDQCDSNLIESALISGAYTGVSLSGGTNSQQSHHNEIVGCRILNSRYGIYVDDQVDCRIKQNEIIPGSPSTVAAVCYGIFVTHLGTGGSVEITGNRIHGFADASGNVSNRACGIYCAAATGGTVTAYNNFIYDFSGIETLKISGFYLSVGTNRIYHNSILFDDVPSINEISGIYISSGTDNDVRNNCIVSLEPDVSSYGIFSTSGGLAVSDYNNFFGSYPVFVTGKLGAVDYGTLSEWRATGFDSNSVAIDPHYVSMSDLHLDTLFADFDNLGDSAVSVQTDIDGEARLSPPDIGADEFTYVFIPDPPAELMITVADTVATLNWLPVADAVAYHVYAASFSDFPLEEIYRIGSVTDTFYVDAAPLDNNRFYKVTAEASVVPASD